MNCHMPPTTYMEIDVRHDHSIRIPRPDLSLVINTPNACTACHLDSENIDAEKRGSMALYQDWMKAARDGDSQAAQEIHRADRWCNDACEKWYGAKRRKDDHWGLALDAGQKRTPEAVERLVNLLKTRGDSAPAIARATALQLLSEVSPVESASEALLHLDDPHPLVRTSAVQAVIGQVDRQQAVSALERGLRDPIRTVRIAAAQQLVQFPRQSRTAATEGNLMRVLEEMRQGLVYSNDRGGSHLAWGSIMEQLGRNSEAIEAYETAIVVEPAMAGPRTNLAALLSNNLEMANSLPPPVRTRMEDRVKELRAVELELLARDVKLLANPPASLIHRYGLALYLNGQVSQAALQLDKAAELDSHNAQYAQMAALIYEKLQQRSSAIYWAEQHVKRSGDDPVARQLLKRIKQQSSSR